MAGDAGGGSTLIVAPTYNERQSLPRLVEGLERHAPGVDLLVVDDGSPDGTGELAEALAADRPWVEVAHRGSKQGLASALLLGLRRAVEEGYDQALQMDADLSHDPAAIPALVSALDGGDLVLGSRYVPGGRLAGWAWHRRLLSRGANLYARAILGSPIRDLTTGFRAFRAAAARRLIELPIRTEGYAFQIEAAYRLHREGFRIVEVPITFTERTAGRSKLSRSIIVEAIVRVWSLRFEVGRRRSQRT